MIVNAAGLEQVSGIFKLDIAETGGLGQYWWASKCAKPNPPTKSN
jgi:hypothetical protein